MTVGLVLLVGSIFSALVGLHWFLSKDRPRVFIRTEGWDPQVILTVLRADQALITPFLNTSFMLGATGLVVNTLALVVRQWRTDGRVRFDRSSLGLTLLWTFLLVSSFQVWRWSSILSTSCSPPELCSREFGDLMVLGYLGGWDDARNWLVTYVLAASAGFVFLSSRIERLRERIGISGARSAPLNRGDLPPSS